MAYAFHKQIGVLENFDLDHTTVKLGGGTFMATKQETGAAGRGKQESPSTNLRWRADLNSVFLSIITLLFGGLYLSIDGRFDSVNGRIDSMNDRINDLSVRMETGFRDVNERLDRLEQRLDDGMQTLQTMFLDHANQHAGGASARDGAASALEIFS